MGYHMEGFPSGQREQTVNLLATLSVVRIHPLPPATKPSLTVGLDCFFGTVTLPFRSSDRSPPLSFPEFLLRRALDSLGIDCAATICYILYNE